MATAGRARAGNKLPLKGRALALLAQREHSAAELRRKLLRHARAELAGADGDLAGGARQASPFRDAGNAGDAGDAADAGDARDAGNATNAAARVDALIDWLRAHRYLSEERFIESRVHARSARYGNLRIRQELAQHGLVLSPQAVQALKDSELQRAREVWQRKFGVVAGDAAQRARQARFLAQRGFSPEVIGRVVRGAAAEGAGDDD
jgi:regulatory protein